MIRRYIASRNLHIDDRRLRRVVERANVADTALDADNERRLSAARSPERSSARSPAAR
jgi:hypothetical protein